MIVCQWYIENQKYIFIYTWHHLKHHPNRLTVAKTKSFSPKQHQLLFFDTTRTALPVGVWPYWWRFTTPVLFPASIYFDWFSAKLRPFLPRLVLCFLYKFLFGYWNKKIIDLQPSVRGANQLNDRFILLLILFFSNNPMLLLT